MRRALAAGTGLVLAAHAAPSLTALSPLRRRLLPGLSGQGRPGGVALTFDDGPDPLGTPPVLDALDRLGWSATFFQLGSQARAHPEVAAEVVARGHEVALHGALHRNHLRRTPQALAADLRDGRDQVEQAAGAAVTLFRPPYGVLSGGTVFAARALRLRTVLWTAWGRDWLVRPPEQVVSTLRRGLADGGTLLLHDSDCTSQPGSWRATAACLPLLADELTTRGLEVRTLSRHLAA
ncbi:MAG: polysaccharide deacetylase [Frankiales bacterium]|nr:polysaccharide deacetylase [Frankiales bacterium]